VIKAEGVLPPDIVVTGVALPKRALLNADFLAVTMIIRVTGITILLQTRPLIGSCALGQHIRALLMAVLTGNAIMLAAQREACDAMVEFLLRLQGKAPQSSQKHEYP
jgi:hypothetical protein